MTAVPPARLGILISGRGSNMAALADACSRGDVRAEVALVISNVPGVRGLEEARRRGLPTLVLEKGATSREEHDRRIGDALEGAGVTLACLAGYMRRLSSGFVKRFDGRLLNVHPSLLPAFPGLDAQRQAWEHGVKVTGCTIHFVDDDVDHGPILLQEAVAVLPDDDVERLSRRILAVEHRLYPRAVGLVADGRVRIAGRRASFDEGPGGVSQPG